MNEHGEFNWEKYAQLQSKKKSQERRMWVMMVLAPESVVASGLFGEVEMDLGGKRFPGILERCEQTFVNKAAFVKPEIREAHELGLIGDDEFSTFSWDQVENECVGLVDDHGELRNGDSYANYTPTFRAVSGKRVSMAGKIAPRILGSESVIVTCDYRCCINQNHLKLGPAPVAWKGKRKA